MARRKIICTWTDSPRAWLRNRKYQEEQKAKVEREVLLTRFTTECEQATEERMQQLDKALV